MQDIVGSETTEEVEPTQQRIIHINAPQPVKYCSNKVRSVFNNKGYYIKATCRVNCFQQNLVQ